MYKLILLSVLISFSPCNNQENKNMSIKDKREHLTKPNIVIFYVDDLGYGDLSSYGAVGVQTPNIDRLKRN